MPFKDDLPNDHGGEPDENLHYVELLIDALSDYILQAEGLVLPLEACDLQPTTRAARLAARAAVIVLLAHDLGQEHLPDEELIDELDLSEDEPEK